MRTTRTQRTGSRIAALPASAVLPQFRRSWKPHADVRYYHLANVWSLGTNRQWKHNWINWMWNFTIAFDNDCCRQNDFWIWIRVECFSFTLLLRLFLTGADWGKRALSYCGSGVVVQKNKLATKANNNTILNEPKIKKTFSRHRCQKSKWNLTKTI